ncbi:MAG: GMC family oxidoreductase [Phycisphaerae bacterium]
MDCDVLVIGSGFGGSVVALRAAAAGLRVVVLERGPRMTERLLDGLRTGRTPVLHRRHNAGLVQPLVTPSLMAMTFNAVGGGSHIYTGVTLPAPDEVFARHWPAGLGPETLAPCYRRVEEVVRPSRIPAPVARTVALETIGRRMNAPVTRLPVAMDWPLNAGVFDRAPPARGLRRDLVTWLGGGPAAAKRTLDRTYLQQAEQHGADVRPLHEVRVIERAGEGYRVHVRRIPAASGNGRNGAAYLSARRVVIAAGTLNTVRLLLACRDRYHTLTDLSPALGRRFFTNGDFGAALVGPAMPVEPDSGPPVTAWIDLWKEDRLYLMETGLSPVFGRLIRCLLGPALRARGLFRKTANGGPARCVWTFGVMGFEDTPGTLRLTRRGSLSYACDGEPDRRFDGRRRSRLRELARAAGATLLMPPHLPANRHTVTIHPLGGAALADSPDDGVTDPLGEVFGHPGLYISDGSLFPTPTGGPPSMPIAAMAERVAAGLIASC